MIEQIQEAVKKNLESPEYEKELQRYANKFYLHARGGWISQNELCKKAQIHHHEMTVILIALVVSNKAISKTESDNVTRFKFTEDVNAHIDFLTLRKEALENEISWINERIKGLQASKQENIEKSD